MKSDDYKPSVDSFLKEVADHKMTGHIINGAYRHLTFSRPGSSVYHFNLTTWPGYLAISGDMGSFVFSRLPDMFEFFRDKWINPQYWAEKIQATNKHGGHRKFSFDLLKKAIGSDFEGWDFDDEEQKAVAWKAITEDLFYEVESSDLQFATSTVMDWKCPITGQEFRDFWEHDLEDYTHHYIWCCRAILWGIEQFDAATAEKEKALAEAANLIRLPEWREAA